MSDLNLHLFGSPSLARDGELIQLDTRKAIALLAYLAVTRQRHTRDRLAGLLWPDYEQTHARASLRRTLSVLHQALAETELEIDRETLALGSQSRLRVDVDEFQRYLAVCRSHQHAPNQTCDECLDPLAAAVTLYRGDFMAGFALRDSPAFDDWQYLQQESLRRDMVSALERLTQGFTLQHEFEHAVLYARRWLELDRLHETAHRHLMLLYAWTGNRNGALHQYRICVRTLEEELGVAPLEATTQLYEAIKENRTPSPPIETGSRSSPLDQPHIASVQTQYPLVERSLEWATLEEVYRGLVGGSTQGQDVGHLVLLEGEAGIGKTRLAEEFISHVESMGARALATRCYEGEANLAYRPLIGALQAALAIPETRSQLASLPAHWLAESARLVPELAETRPGLAPAPPLESPGAQSRFFEGLARALSTACSRESETSSTSRLPGILFLDDIQWADRATLDLLTYMARRLPEFPLCLLLTWRNIEVPNSPRIHRLIAESERSGHTTRIALSRLTPAGIRRLAESQLGSQSDRAEGNGHLDIDAIVARLYQETEGLPLFLVEYISTLVGGRHADTDPEWSLPGGIRELLHLRLQMLGESSWQILTTASVIGRSFDFATLREASGRSEEETIEALEDLVRQSLVVEVSLTGAHEPMYDFTHEKVRTLVYEETSLARRRLLHRRVAESLSGRPPAGHRQSDSLPGQIARHYLQAGLETLAAEYFKLAGERARAVYANAEAVEHLSTALALGHPDAVGLHEAIGDLYTFLGMYGAALTSYETAAALSHLDALAPLEQKIGGVYLRRGDWELAESHFQAALDSLYTLDSRDAEDEKDGVKEPRVEGMKARIYSDWSLAVRYRGQLERALRLATEALALAELAHDIQARAQVHNMLGILDAGQGNLDQAIRQLEESLALASSLPDRSGARVAALNNLALTLGASGEQTRAIGLAEEALSLAATQGDRHREAALHNNLADLLHAAGRSGEALEHVKQSVTIYAEIGVEAGTVQPEIWKLAEW
jgi:DNA-binding SARP family transcriptional activator/tetratricopeptide (TPR) repeat protein